MLQTVEVDGIEVHIEGEGAETILMLHGWPDTHLLWDAQVAALGGHYRCVRFTLPGFDLRKPPRPCSVDDMTGLIERIVRQVSPERPVIMLQHDWGSVFGTQFALRHPQLVSRIIAVDVGDVFSAEYSAGLSLFAKLGTAGYQLWLALAWRVAGRGGGAMTRMMAAALRAPAPNVCIGWQMNYPYYIKWMGAYGSFRNVGRSMPACPALFIYGKRKPFHFHSRDWAARLNATAGSRSLSMKTGHWVMHEQPQAFNAAVLDWLRA